MPTPRTRNRPSDCLPTEHPRAGLGSIKREHRVDPGLGCPQSPHATAIALETLNELPVGAGQKLGFPSR